MKLTKKDISVIIPSYNRSEDLEKKTLSSLKNHYKSIKEVIVVDQSKYKETENLIKRLKIKNLKYVRSDPPSITIARNKGVSKVSKNSKIVCFLDDDVSIGEDYFDKVLEIFNENESIMGISGYQDHGNIKFLGRIKNFVKALFFLGHFEKGRARMFSAYGNNYSFPSEELIPAEWLPGFNMVYRKKVFENLKFDENLLGYTIAEDTDFSYNVSRKYKNSLIISPFVKIKHLTSFKERYADRKMSYINQIDHFYFNFKNMNKNFKQKVIFIWSLSGIFILRIFSLLSFNKKNYLNLFYFIESLFYCMHNIDKIKSGKLRDFNLN